MGEPIDHDKLRSTRNYVRALVAGGLDPYCYVLDVATEDVAESISVELVDDVARQMVDEAFDAHFREQATWPAVTDCDKLDKAFNELNRAGIVARHHFSCCGTCAVAEISQIMEELASADVVVRGYTSYDIQSTEAAVEGCGVALNYGSAEDGEEAALRIGHEVVDALARQGLRAEWDGSWDHRIIVLLDWKRRRDSTLPENRASD